MPGANRMAKERWNCFFSKGTSGPNFGSALPIFGSQVSVAALQEYSNVLAPAVLEPRGTGGGRGRAKSISKEVLIFFSKGRTSVPDTRDLEPQCRRPCPPLREKWCGGGGGDDPICLPRKKLGGKALRRGSGTAGEAQGRKKGTQGRVSEIFKCNKTC